MNVKKTIFAVVGCAVILVLLVIRLGFFEKKKTQTESEKTTVVKTAQKTVETTVKTVPKKRETVIENKKTEPEKIKVPESQKIAEEEKALGIGDPFAYANSNSGDYMPLSGSKQVGIITVKGIIRMEGEAPKAILYLKDSDRVHYVSKDSVVRVSSKTRKGTSPADAYIVVKDIRNDEVELIQLERPDKVIIIR